MNIKAPYCLFLGDAKDSLSIKIALGIVDWRPELVLCEHSLPEGNQSTGFKQLEIDEAAKKGAKTLVLGLANSGGTIAAQWLPGILKAIESGMDVASGLHQKLESIKEIKNHAEKFGVKLINVRHPGELFKTGTGVRRTGKRLLTVGTDCSVGKMYTGLAINKKLTELKVSNDFIATGQSGIFITGKGVAIDCVISDFVAGAVEQLSPNNKIDHWDIIEGQGSLFHPAFAGVSLSLLHGAQPDALVLCHAECRENMRGIANRKLPSLEETMNANLQAARVTNSRAKFIGISVNTSMLNKQKAEAICKKYESQFGLPCFDPLRQGVDKISSQF